MILSWENSKFSFQPVEIHFVDNDIENIFARKNNKTLLETLKHPRYGKFKNEVLAEYREYLNWELGKFLLVLKTNQDEFYLKFLNKYGDRKFCHFYIDDEEFQDKMGLYVFTQNQQLRYIGRCLDTFRKRINQGYGKIYPKNCFLDGQATNCHLNSLIAESIDKIEFLVCPMKNRGAIKEIELNLIGKFHPLWNISK